MDNGNSHKSWYQNPTIIVAIISGIIAIITAVIGIIPKLIEIQSAQPTPTLTSTHSPHTPTIITKATIPPMTTPNSQVTNPTGDYTILWVALGSAVVLFVIGYLVYLTIQKLQKKRYAAEEKRIVETVSNLNVGPQKILHFLLDKEHSLSIAQIREELEDPSVKYIFRTTDNDFNELQDCGLAIKSGEVISLSETAGRYKKSILARLNEPAS